MTEILIKQGARVLTPEEYKTLRSALNPKHKLIFDGMLFTGMRIAEFWRFVDHPQWFHPGRQYIDLPKGASLKKKAKMQERMIMLSHMGNRAIEDLVDAINRGEIEKISRVGWNDNLKRAAINSGLDLKGIVPKMTRKTWVSWLMVTYPEDGLRVAASSGHDTKTMQYHYLNLPFSRQEQQEIKGYVIGWGGRHETARNNGGLP